MTDTASRQAGKAWETESRGIEWHLEVDQMPLLPGRLVTGRIRLVARRGVDARAVVVALRAEEHWRHQVTQHHADGSTSTRVVREERELTREPVMVHGTLRLADGVTWRAEFELPVPAMGPASLEAEEAGLTWTIEGKLDIDDGFDSSIEATVLVAQPLALLRAGAVHVGEFALYESADVVADGLTGSISFESMPLVTDGPFNGLVRLQLGGGQELQEIRAEIRVRVEATVSGGQSETVTAWAGVIAAGGRVEGSIDLPIVGSLAARPLPTIELPHGKAQATFHVILARAWAPDTHLVRDVTIATTREL